MLTADYAEEKELNSILRVPDVNRKNVLLIVRLKLPVSTEQAEDLYQNMENK